MCFELLIIYFILRVHFYGLLLLTNEDFCCCVYFYFAYLNIKKMKKKSWPVPVLTLELIDRVSYRFEVMWDMFQVQKTRQLVLTE